MTESNQMTGTVANTLAGTIVCLQAVAAAIATANPGGAPYLRKLLIGLRDGSAKTQEQTGPGFEIPFSAMIEMLDAAEAGKSPPSFSLITGGKDDDEQP